MFLESQEPSMDARALLDELMGKDRDLPLDQKNKRKLRFDDPEVPCPKRKIPGVSCLVYHAW